MKLFVFPAQVKHETRTSYTVILSLGLSASTNKATWATYKTLHTILFTHLNYFLH